MTRKIVYRIDKAGRATREAPAAPMEVDAPFVQDDTIPPTESHATDERRIFTSRQGLNDHYRAHGYECTGGSHLTGRHGPVRKNFDCEAERSRKAQWGMLRVDPEMRAQVLEEQRKLKWGMSPLSERERERCQREEAIYKRYEKNQSR